MTEKCKVCELNKMNEDYRCEHCNGTGYEPEPTKTVERKCGNCRFYRGDETQHMWLCRDCYKSDRKLNFQEKSKLNIQDRCMTEPIKTVENKCESCKNYCPTVNNLNECCLYNPVEPKTVESLDSILKRFESDNDSGVNEAKQELEQWYQSRHKQEMVDILDKEIDNLKKVNLDGQKITMIKIEALTNLRSKILEGK